MKIKCDGVAYREDVTFAVSRVIDNLIKYSFPEHSYTYPLENADLVIFHLNGRVENFTEKIKSIVASGKKYACIQYALRSTLNPNTKDWIDIWNGAECVWSYYDLEALCEEDGVDFSGVNFYHAPLGVDEHFKTLKYHGGNKNYTIVCNARRLVSESLWSIHKAVNKHDGLIFNTGYDLGLIENIVSLGELSEEQLVKVYNDSDYVSGLRRHEGFELPAIEAFFCGARPILFDKPHYKKWFHDIAEFIPETNKTQIINDLSDIFSKPVRKVTKEEQDAVRDRFSWEIIIKNFYNRITL